MEGSCILCDFVGLLNMPDGLAIQELQLSNTRRNKLRTRKAVKGISLRFVEPGADFDSGAGRPRILSRAHASPCRLHVLHPRIHYGVLVTRKVKDEAPFKQKQSTTQNKAFVQLPRKADAGLHTFDSAVFYSS